MALKIKSSTAVRRAKRTLRKIETLAASIVESIASRVDREGVLEDFDRIEAEKEVRSSITKMFADFNRSR